MAIYWRILLLAFALAAAVAPVFGQPGNPDGAPSGSEEEPEYGPQAEPDEGSPPHQAPRLRPRQPNPQGMTEDELRMKLLQKSMRFGGIFGPLVDELNKPGKPDECGRYTDYGACQAYKAGDGWAADRLQRHEASPSERDWYDR